DILRYEELLRVAAAACRLGVRKIRVTGGEPLVRRGLVPFIRSLAQLPEKPEIVLTTNGILLARHAADLKAAGLRRVNVSLDTLREDRFRAMTRNESGLGEVLAGLKAAEEAGLHPIKLNVIPLRGFNEDEIIDFALLTRNHDWEVRFIEFMPISADLDYVLEDGVPFAQIDRMLQSLGDLEERPRPATAGPARLYRLPGALGQIGLIPSVSGHFCGECNRLRVTADGRIRGCLFDNREIDLKPVLRSEEADATLEDLLRNAACAKPEKHAIGSGGFQRPNRRMHGIGG
ncbi:MAG: GTP 3',8-cyclase MoaA, partial [Alphaproteobacteria bacterium]|nr:GTP 3',8-cyclase MoaA [Alphaproteobacteria bacterium]